MHVWIRLDLSLNLSHAGDAGLRSLENLLRLMLRRCCDHKALIMHWLAGGGLVVMAVGVGDT